MDDLGLKLDELSLSSNGGSGDFAEGKRCYFKSDEQTNLLIGNIERMRLDSNYSDLVIVIDDHRFPCHKVKLDKKMLP